MIYNMQNNKKSARVFAFNENKYSQNDSKRWPKCSRYSFYLKVMYFKIAQESQHKILDIFV